MLGSVEIYRLFKTTKNKKSGSRSASCNFKNREVSDSFQYRIQWLYFNTSIAKRKDLTAKKWWLGTMRTRSQLLSYARNEAMERQSVLLAGCQTEIIRQH